MTEQSSSASQAALASAEQRTLHVPEQRRLAERPVVELTTLRLNVMRVGYGLMGVGLAAVKWPLLDDLNAMPAYEGVMNCLFIALSVLALLGLRYPVRMLPVLLFEVAWKALWFAVVALPAVVAGDLTSEQHQVAVNSALGIVVLLVIPWRHVWQRLVRGAGDPWR